jgi:hypothetical protein
MQIWFPIISKAAIGVSLCIIHIVRLPRLLNLTLIAMVFMSPTALTPACPIFNCLSFLFFLSKCKARA